ncbi:Fe-S cluster assembly ATPase SufC [candidate division WWE3 bacterium RBG_19FT_COMBO_53_11]|uniref:Fe-S cluster assembly ATPase SufC n=1 Tax=candidate division WWE3 bacterium RBG_19FT_COMBO_53_11 TaxID=1802613 RepID=A0A1F4UIF5_UNCKA|nr:MAG: Fe-S cluster assembly ATPase SufC [candidate division WWE3 bacterium RBG_16_52_45]OGC44755.1 MAG: Fe-S cluster assembly ATPase SufC [candidate division WWE3 bacterium RBG_19FT_COMBO_53_11]
MKKTALEVHNLKVSIGEKEVLRGLDLTIGSGEIHALMGPNGSGKSTLALALAGHPGYSVSGRISLDRRELSSLPPEKRFRAGLFLAFQYPVGIEGVSLFNFIKTAKKGSAAMEILSLLNDVLPKVGLEESFLRRTVNLDLSGGEKKRSEVLQALALKPKFAIFDEIDSGLDVDALKMIAASIRFLADEGTGVLIITHYQRILKYLDPNYVHVLIDGKITATGGGELAEKLEKEGYKSFRWTAGERPRNSLTRI